MASSISSVPRTGTSSELDALLEQAARVQAVPARRPAGGQVDRAAVLQSVDAHADQFRAGRIPARRPRRSCWPRARMRGRSSSRSARSWTATPRSTSPRSRGCCQRYVDLIGVRAFPEIPGLVVDREDTVIRAFAKYATVPVINMETITHPCQELAHIMALQQHLGARLARKQVRADLDLPPEAAEYRRGQFGAADRHALWHGRDPAVPDAGVRARCALHGLRRGATSPPTAARCASATTSKAPTAAPTSSMRRAGARLPFFGRWDDESPSATRTSTSSSTKPRWR